jgi:hypothetical protein
MYLPVVEEKNRTRVKMIQREIELIMNDYKRKQIEARRRFRK